MPSETTKKIIYLNKVYLEAIKNIIHNSQIGKELKIDFQYPNRIKISNWSQANPICRKFLQNYNSIMKELNTIKISQPSKKIQRIKFMKKWKQQFQIPGLNIIMVKRDVGQVYYLMGCASQLQLFNVTKNFQKHSYKTYTGNFLKFLYKPALEALIFSSDYQISVYQKLKVTSTQMKFITVESQNHRKAKFIELLFELEEYVQTIDLIEKYKQILTQQYFVFCLMLQKEKKDEVKTILEQIQLTGYKIWERKKQQKVYGYIVVKINEVKVKFVEVMNKCSFIKDMTFLRGIGPTHQVLQSLLENNDDFPVKKPQNYLLQNFDIKGNSAKHSNQILLSIKQRVSTIDWDKVSENLIKQ